ncbi:MAG: hypothetical protein HQ539_01060 [Parcubacteria group bacterium]|nr:hypothetical protein [Parcubacteria group bacterium]
MVPDLTSDTTELTALVDGAKTALRWVLSSELQRDLFPLKIIFVLFGIGFLIMIVYFIARTSYMDWWFMGFLKDFLFPKIFAKKLIIKKWKKIKKGLEKDFEEQWKLTVVEGANLVDRILKDAGYAGDDLGERLKRVDEEEIINLEQLKKAQLITEEIITNPDYKLTKHKAEAIINAFDRSLTDMNIL